MSELQSNQTYKLTDKEKNILLFKVSIILVVIAVEECFVMLHVFTLKNNDVKKLNWRYENKK